MYYSIEKLMNDLFKLKDTTIFITDMVEYDLSTLDSTHYRFIKNTMSKNNVKVLVIKQDSDKKLKIK